MGRMIEMTYCSNCGAENADGAAFCRVCGQPVKNAAQSAGQPGNPYYVQPPYCQQPQTPGYGGQAPWMQPPKKKKNLTWLWIVLGVVAAAAIAFSVWFFGFERKPEKQLDNAVIKTERMLPELFDHAENFRDFVKTVSGCRTSFKGTYSMVSEKWDYCQNHELCGKVDFGKKIVVLDYRGGDGKKDDFSYDLKAQAAISGEEIQLNFPGLDLDVASFPLSDVSIDPDWISLLQYADEGRGFLGGLAKYTGIAEVREERVRIGGSKRECQIYELNVNQSLIDDVMNILEDCQAVDDLSDILVESFSFIVEDGLLRGIRVEASADDEESSVELLLEGEENPWSHIALYNRDHEAIMELSIKPAKDGFSARAEAFGNTVKITCNDSRKCLTLKDDYDRLDIDYDVQDGKAVVTFGEEDNYHTEITLEPDSGLKAEMLSDDPEEFDLTGDDLMDFLDAVSDARWKKEGYPGMPQGG